MQEKTTQRPCALTHKPVEHFSLALASGILYLGHKLMAVSKQIELHVIASLDWKRFSKRARAAGGKSMRCNANDVKRIISLALDTDKQITLVGEIIDEHVELSKMLFNNPKRHRCTVILRAGQRCKVLGVTSREQLMVAARIFYNTAADRERGFRRTIDVDEAHPGRSCEHVGESQCEGCYQ